MSSCEVFLRGYSRAACRLMSHHQGYRWAVCMSGFLVWPSHALSMRVRAHALSGRRCRPGVNFGCGSEVRCVDGFSGQLVTGCHRLPGGAAGTMRPASRCSIASPSPCGAGFWLPVVPWYPRSTSRCPFWHLLRGVLVRVGACTAIQYSSLMSYINNPKQPQGFFAIKFSLLDIY